MSKRGVAVGCLLVVGIVVVGLAVAGMTLGNQPPKIVYLTAKAVVTDVRDAVSASGSVQPKDTYALAFGEAPVRSAKATTASAAAAAAPRWTVDTVDVVAGQSVKAGDILAAADTTDAGLALDLARANLDAAKARLKADENPVTSTGKAKAKLGVTQANSQLSQAKKAQSQTASSGNLAISQASAALSDAQTRLKKDRAANAPAAVISADSAAVKQASRALATAKRQAASANSQAAGQVASARLGVTSANLAYKSATNVDTDAAVAADRAAVVQAESALTDAQRTLDRATLRSPIDGVVSSVVIQPGDSASGVVIVVRGTDMEVAASITESDLPSVRAGEPAEVTIDALKASVHGTVDSVDVAGATKSASGVVSYAIVIALDEVPDGVASSMTAGVDITTAASPHVLAVPVTAIGGVPGAYTVQVLDGPDSVRTVPVEVGLLTATLAEIKSGIDEGTTVVTGTASAKDLVTTFPTGPGGGGGVRSNGAGASQGAGQGGQQP